MPSFFTRSLLIISCFFLSLTKAVANDSDQVNCNRAWKVVILGSSSSYGYGASVYDSAWVGKFTAYVKRKHPQNEIINLGIPGFTTYQNLCPTGFIPPANRPAPSTSFNITAALSYHPDAIIINMPSNDAANDFTVAEQQANFERTMHLADSANVPVWVTTTQPRNNMSPSQTSAQLAMRDWIYTRFGDKAVDFWSTIANPDGSIATFYDYDYAHVNDFGHEVFYRRMIAETVLDSLCARVTQILVARAGNDASITLPTNTTTLDGTGSFSSLGGVITNYQWAKLSGPATGQIVSPTSAITSVNNLSEGRYAFSLTVTDNAANVKTDTVNVVVSSRILIDFGPTLTTSPDGNGRYWNNITDAQNGVKLSNAITTGNVSTAIGLTVVNRIDGTFNVAGPGTNSGNTNGAVGDYPVNAVADFAFAEPSATNGQWRLTGLEATKQYTIKFWGTRSVADERVIQIKRADQSTWQEYNATNNVIYSNAAIFTFSGKTQMTFDIRVKSGSAFGHICVIDITRTTPAVALNIPPVARANDVTVSLPATSGTLDGTASSDDDGSIEQYLWTQTSGPNTAQIVTATAAITTINNLVQGVYTFNLKVTDDSLAFANTSVTVTVNSRILFDIGPDLTSGADAGGKFWNNVTDGLPGVKIANAVSTGNSPTGVSLTIINRIDGTFNINGPGTNTGNTIGIVGDYPNSATTDFAFAHPSATNGQWKLSGLESSKQYSIKFWGTRTAGDERVIRIKRSDETTWKQYDARNNTDYNNAAVFSFTGKTEMTFDISVDVNSAFGHISVVDVQASDPPVQCAPSVVITSNQSVATCSGSPVTFTAVPTNGGTTPVYQWRRNGVNISGANAASFTTTTLLNNDVITCFLTANTSCPAGTTALSNAITVSVLPIVPKAGVISGPVNVCSLIGTNNNVYSIAPLPNATIYVWTVPNGATIISGQGTNTIVVGFNNNLGTVDTISVLGGFCTNSAPSKLVLNKTVPAIPGAISGPVNVCPFVDQPQNAVYSIVAVPNATSYTWTVPTGANIVNGQGTTSIQVSFTGAFISGSIKVSADAACGSRAPRSLTVVKTTVSAPGAISGPTSACPFIGTATTATYSIAPVANASSYAWTLPANVNIISGQGTTSITVSFGSAYTSATIKVKSVSTCSSSSDRSLNVTASATSTPGAITGPTNACAYLNSGINAPYSIRKVSNASSYIWTVPAGATIISHPGGTGINDTIIMVSFDNSFVSGTLISVRSGGCIPSSPRSLAIQRSAAPGAPGAISGTANPCAIVGTSSAVAYRITKSSTASSYNWVIPAGATATHPNGPGANDTIVLLSFSTGFSGGTLSVTAVNGCGSSIARTFSIQTLAPSSTPVITGPTDPCPWIGTSGATYTINKIPNATGYTWGVPAAGATVTHPNGAGVNDTVIIVNYTAAFVSGSITARADAACGSSSTRTLALVRRMPSTAGGITATLLTTCPNRSYSYSIAALPANAVSATWTVPAGATIVSGQGTTSITVTYPATAVSGGVTVVGTNNCGNSSSVRTLKIALPACSVSREPLLSRGVPQAQEAKEALSVTALPNPSYGDIGISIQSGDRISPVTVRISDLNGKFIESHRVMAGSTALILGSKLGKGIYLAEVIQASTRKVVKLVKL